MICYGVFSGSCRARVFSNSARGLAVLSREPAAAGLVAKHGVRKDPRCRRPPRGSACQTCSHFVKSVLQHSRGARDVGSGSPDASGGALVQK